jgi:hypothetical protein
MITIKSNGRSKRANGTSLIEYIDIEYDTLVNVLGEPMTGEDTDEYKVDAEWHVEIHDEANGHDGFVTVYNYKTGKHYLGEDGLPVEEITTWHVGGRSGYDLELLMEYILQNTNQD